MHFLNFKLFTVLNFLFVSREKWGKEKKGIWIMSSLQLRKSGTQLIFIQLYEVSYFGFSFLALLIFMFNHIEWNPSFLKVLKLFLSLVHSSESCIKYSKQKKLMMRSFLVAIPWCISNWLLIVLYLRCRLCDLSSYR